MNDATPFDRMEQLFEQMRREMWAGWPRWDRAGTGGPVLPTGDDGAGFVDRSVFDAGDASEPATVERVQGVRLERTDDAVNLVADLPGFEREDIDLRVADGVLTVHAVHEHEDEADTDFRSRRLFERVTLPGDVDVDEATATYRNGVLEISFPAADHDAAHTSIDVE